MILPRFRSKLCAFLACCAAMAAGGHAQTFTTLANFNGVNGAGPRVMALVQGTNGYFYGTTSSGGSNGFGTAFQVTPAGALTAIHSFAGADGANPNAGLVLATDGTFYGTTAAGAHNNCGTIFQITPRGTLTTLHYFSGPDGCRPEDPLIQIGNGDFFGTTYLGGNSVSGADYGTIFDITPGGTFNLLHTFDVNDGISPSAGLIETPDGKFFGTTEGGPGYHAQGEAFSYSSGKLIVLYAFGTGVNGGNPSGLLQASDGNLYGTTFFDGSSHGGTAFQLTMAGALTVLYSFCSQANCADGENPSGGLIQATDGNFYGTTRAGGADNCGTIYSLTLTGTLTTLHSFNCTTDGLGPSGALLQATDGNFYGVTPQGGTGNCTTGCGTVFKLSIGLAPFVKTLPDMGTVGTAVRILGSNLTGASSVTFNGVAAQFTVVAASEITTKVPAGATTGTVQVTTPQGTMSSNVPFRVP